MKDLSLPAFLAFVHSVHRLILEIVPDADLGAITEVVKRADGKRPDGMTMIPFWHGKALVWGATVLDTVAVSHIVGSTAQAGRAAREAEDKKLRTYAELEGQYLFVPLAFKTFGTWGAQSKRLIAEIGRRITNQTGKKRTTDFFTTDQY
ncbi:hypothetical protein BV898_13089 [Hypsibius exemplaris]|uniref:Uncharacterized protein n=1 Tax=Hypsibius exemplaris TaxID=2072580 RepID=A0A1W0WBU6_HYPEX|nr:hypothetical protein BV898_13089 [Hypsibius exemplaris]